MEKKKVLFLILILFIALLFRLWGLNSDNFQIASGNFYIPKDFFTFFFTNAFAPVYYLFTKLFTLPYINKVAEYSSTICDGISVLALYFVGKEFNDKKNDILTGLISSGIGAISVYLISLSKSCSMYSLAFMLSCFVILFSLKVLNTQNKKYLIHTTIFSILLFLTYNLSLFFIVFNYLAIAGFYAKKRKTFEAYFTTFTSLVLLFLPAIPFILNIINTPDYLDKYSLPFNYEHILVYLTNMFSAKLTDVGEFELQNIGFWIFVIVPTLIGFTLSINGVIGKKTSNPYSVSLFISTFLSMLIMCVFGNEAFLSKYLITVYPILIMTMANGVPSLKSKTLKVVLPTIFATIIIFYIIAKHFVSTSLF